VAALENLPRPAVPGLAWTGPEQWHVTLRFLGGVAAGDVPAVVESLRGARWPAGPVVAVAGPETARFSNRVLQVPVGGLEGVARTAVRATKRFGEPPENRPFHAHITLARSRGADLRPLCGAALVGEWVVDEVTLVQSHLGRGGARYEVVERVVLESNSRSI